MSRSPRRHPDKVRGYRAIRAALPADHRRFATDPDSEIALHLYDKRSDEFVHQLRGEYAVPRCATRASSEAPVQDASGPGQQ